MRFESVLLLKVSVSILSGINYEVDSYVEQLFVSFTYLSDKAFFPKNRKFNTQT